MLRRSTISSRQSHEREIRDGRGSYLSRKTRKKKHRKRIQSKEKVKEGTKTKWEKKRTERINVLNKDN